MTTQPRQDLVLKSSCDHSLRECLQVLALASWSPGQRTDPRLPEEWHGSYQIWRCTHPACGAYWATSYTGQGYLELAEADALVLAYPFRDVPRKQDAQ